jgi:hypothetical protein
VRRPAIIGVLVVMAVAACSGGGASAASLVAQACHGSVPILPGQSTSKTYGETLAGYKRAETFTTRAAAKDARWEKLNEAYGTLIFAWSPVVAITGEGYQRGYALTDAQETQLWNVYRWSGLAAAAGDTVRSECAVAAAAK